MMPNPRKVSLTRNPNLPQEAQPTTSHPPFPTTTTTTTTGNKETLFSIDRTFSASSEFFEDDDDEDEPTTTVTAKQLQQQYNSKAREVRRREFFQQFQDPDDEISVSVLPSSSDLPRGRFVDIEENVIGEGTKTRRQLQKDEDEEDDDDDDDYFEENEKHVATSSIISDHHHIIQTNSQMNSSGGDHHHHDSIYNEGGDSSNNDVNNVGTSHKSGVHRKKSILRHVHDHDDKTGGGGGGGGVGVSVNNSFAGSSSIISDGKMGSSLNGSFNNSQFYNNFYSRAARRNDFQRYTRGPYAPLDRCNSTSASSAHSSTITQHYYPEAGWGFVVLATALFSHALLCGFLLCGGVFATKVLQQFGHELREESIWLISLSLGVSLILSPLWVSICKRKSTRLTAVFGGLVTSLGCLFTSFASQFHQLFFSYVIFMGVGVGLTRDASMLMVGQYFKRRRDFVEIFLVSGSGLGILVMSIFMEFALSSIGWRLGLQAVTGTLALTFFLGSCYRSASLYHPQRRAIIHLKNQKRKIKEKEKKNDGPPFLDISCLASRSLQMLLVSCFTTACGLYSPLFHLALEYQDDEVMEDIDKILIYVYIGAGWIIGTWLFGFLAIQRNEQCRISKLYLCQVAGLLCGLSIIALTNVKEEEASGLVTFSWVYGIGLGGYHYMLKVHLYEKFRARVFPRAWSFIQSVQGAGLLFGIPVTGYINTSSGNTKKGYFLSAAAIFLGFFIMCISGMGARRLTRHKSSRSSMKTCETTDSLQSPGGCRRISFTFPDEQMSPPRFSKDERSSVSGSSERSSRIPRNLNSGGGGGGGSGSYSGVEQQMIQNKELTRISEEGILDTNH